VSLDRHNVSRESLERLEAYARLLIDWQKRINLVGPSTIESLWERHIADCVQLNPLVRGNGTMFADLGSGAGLPGLVLAIAGNFGVHLYESNAKKCAFLREAARVTATDATIHNVRLEAPGPIPKIGFVTARALAPLVKLLQLASPFLATGVPGYFHKGQDIEAELTFAAKSWRIESTRHQSMTDSRAVILEVKEAHRVSR
jgi:16S rRNA (guanine527-N7)-methyltransferase